MKRLPKVATEMALNVLAYNMKRVMAVVGLAGLLEALATWPQRLVGSSLKMTQVREERKWLLAQGRIQGILTQPG